MAKQVNIHEAKTHFSKLIAEVEAGDEIIVARGGKPILKLVKIEQKRKPIVPGFAQGTMTVLTEQEWDELHKEFLSLFREKNFEQ